MDEKFQDLSMRTMMMTIPENKLFGYDIGPTWKLRVSVAFYVMLHYKLFQFLFARKGSYLSIVLVAYSKNHQKGVRTPLNPPLHAQLQWMPTYPHASFKV